MAKTSKKILQKMFEALLGLPPREADLALLEGMTRNASDEEAAEVVAEYVHDHWLGEPKTPTVKSLARKALAATCRRAS